MISICGVRSGRAVIIGAAAAFGASGAQAGSASSNMGVSATVSANCSVSTRAIDFGSVNTLAGDNVDGTGDIIVTCTNGTSWSASAGLGGGSGATFASRKMTAGSNRLSYSLYIDGSYGSVWGDGTSSSAQVSGTGTGTAQTRTIYGRVFSGQTGVPAGSYSDTVSVTVSY